MVMIIYTLNKKKSCFHVSKCSYLLGLSFLPTAVKQLGTAVILFL